MIAYLKAFASLRNVVILAGVIFTAYTTHIWLKNKKIDSLERENLEQQLTISKFESAQTTNLTTIDTLQSELQQCALGKEINDSNSKLELARQQGRIADIETKYENLRKQNMQKMGCYPVRIDPDLFDQLCEANPDCNN